MKLDHLTRRGSFRIRVKPEDLLISGAQLKSHAQASG
jgi:hypothetical protein